MSPLSLNDARTGIFLPPLSSLEYAPFINPFFYVKEGDTLMTYPLSLYRREGHGKMKWLGFIYAFLFTRKDGKKTLQITYPLCFDHDNAWEIYERLFSEVEELASDAGAFQIEYEGYQNMRGKMFYPLSSVAFGSQPDPFFLEFIKSKKFIQKDILSCYQVEWSFIPQDKYKPLHCYTLSGFRQRKIHYLDLCRASESFAQRIDPDCLPSLPPPITERFFAKKEWIIFTESGNQRGCLRWVPQSLFDKEMKREAKVMRMLFSDATSEFMHASVVEMLNTILTLGMNRIQISDIQDRESEKYLRERGAFPVYEIIQMVYEIKK